MYCYQTRLTIMEGLLPYARGLFYQLPVSSAQLNTWHPHIYDKPVQNPTPFYITNILDLDPDLQSADDNQRTNINNAISVSGERTLYSKDLLHAGRLFSGSGHYHRVVVRTGSTEARAEKDDELPVGQRNAPSPCTYLRDRVESPQEGNLRTYSVYSESVVNISYCISDVMFLYSFDRKINS